MQTFSFLIGLVFGSALGLILFCYMVPHGPKAIGMFRHYAAHMKGHEKTAARNSENFKALYASTSSQMPQMNHINHGSNNPYMMNAVTSEKQFLEDMILHHDAAVVMAKQVLGVQGIHEEVKNLANEIIKAQTKEISQMRTWISTWK